MIDRTQKRLLSLQTSLSHDSGEETDEAVLDQLEDANISARYCSHARALRAELAWHTLEEMLEAHNSGSAAAGAVYHRGRRQDRARQGRSASASNGDGASAKTASSRGRNASLQRECTRFAQWPTWPFTTAGSGDVSERQ